MGLTYHSDLPPLGLYRHFKGNHYFLHNVARNADKDCMEYMCYYFNVLHPEYGYFTRSASEWLTDVHDREDNVTGQTYRFERVVSIDNGIQNFTTDQLLRELSVRKDSPLQCVDYPGLARSVYAIDFAVGTKQEATDEPRGVFTEAAFSKEQDARDFMRNHSRSYGPCLFKRTFIEI